MRSKAEYFLVGKSISYISGSKLLTQDQVFSYSLHVRSLSSSKHLSEIIGTIVFKQNCFGQWLVLRITEQNVKKRLEKVFSEWSTIKKNKGRKSDPRAVVLKVWVATQTWVAEGQKMGRAHSRQGDSNPSKRFFAR